MGETADPLLALDAKDIPTRAAGARDLGKTGAVEHLDRLIALSIGDKSPGVRLSTATAAADILSRVRLDPARGLVATSDRERWLAVVSSVDPSLNTALFQIAAVLDIPAGVQRVVTGLRDPRHDVRAGACVGLWRLIQSGANNGNTELERRVVAVLADKGLRIETRAEIARMCSCVGYLSARDAAEAMAGEAIRLTKTLLDATVVRFSNPPSLLGLWVSDGADTDEAAQKRKAGTQLAVLGQDDAIRLDGSHVERGPLAGPVRTVLTRKEGESALAVQVGQRTFWAADPEDVCAFGDTVLASKHAAWLDDADGILGTSSAGLRVRGVRLLAQGKLAEGLETLEAAVAGKKVPADAWWHLADALARSGRAEEGRPHLEKYLAKAGKRAPFSDEAKKRLE